MPASHAPLRQQGFYLDKDGLLVRVSNPGSRFVESEQECNFHFLDDIEFKELIPIPTSDLEEVAHQYDQAGCAHKAGWIREYLEREKLRTASQSSPQ